MENPETQVTLGTNTNETKTREYNTED